MCSNKPNIIQMNCSTVSLRNDEIVFAVYDISVYLNLVHVNDWDIRAHYLLSMQCVRAALRTLYKGHKQY